MFEYGDEHPTFSREELKGMLRVLRGGRVPREEPDSNVVSTGQPMFYIVSLEDPRTDLKSLLGYFVNRAVRGSQRVKLICAPSNPLSDKKGEVIDFNTRKKIVP